MMANFFAMGLFPKMKMRRDGVFEKVYQEKTDQDIKKGPLTGNPHRLRYHLNKRHRQHVSSAQRQKILQISPRPILPNNKIAANQIPRRRHQPQQRRQPSPECQVMHLVSSTDTFVYPQLRRVCVPCLAVIDGHQKIKPAVSALSVLRPSCPRREIFSLPSSRMPEQNHIAFLHN